MRSHAFGAERLDDRIDLRSPDVMPGSFWGIGERNEYGTGASGRLRCEERHIVQVQLVGEAKDILCRRAAAVHHNHRQSCPFGRQAAM